MILGNNILRDLKQLPSKQNIAMLPLSLKYYQHFVLQNICTGAHVIPYPLWATV